MTNLWTNTQAQDASGALSVYTPNGDVAVPNSAAWFFWVGFGVVFAWLTIGWIISLAKRSTSVGEI